jgi:hypothetical protein
VLALTLSLFNLSFSEQDTPSHNRIKLDETDLFCRSTDIFACRVEKSSSCGTGQLDGNGLAAAAGHLECWCGKHAVNSFYYLQKTELPRDVSLQDLMDKQQERLSREKGKALIDLCYGDANRVKQAIGMLFAGCQCAGRPPLSTVDRGWRLQLGF